MLVFNLWNSIKTRSLKHLQQTMPEDSDTEAFGEASIGFDALLIALAAIDGISTDFEQASSPDLDEEERSSHVFKVSKEDAAKAHDYFHILRMNKIIFAKAPKKVGRKRNHNSSSFSSFTPQISTNSARLATKFRSKNSNFTKS